MVKDGEAWRLLEVPLQQRPWLRTIATIQDINVDPSTARTPATADADNVTDASGPHCTMATSEHEGVTLAAVGTGAILTILRSVEVGIGKYEVTGDLEFDGNIASLSWSPTGSLLLVGQGNGAIHFVSPSAVLIFSHTVLSSKNLLFLKLLSLMLYDR
jgi:hypothetical protein